MQAFLFYQSYTVFHEKLGISKNKGTSIPPELCLKLWT